MAWPALLALAFAALLLHVVPDALGGYGYFIDELYYLSCARRLAFGYVDHPPLAPLLLRGVTTVLGDSLSAIRFLPALGSGALVLQLGALTARLGGGRFAQLLAGLATLCAPYLLLIFGFFSMNFIEPLVWTGLVAVVVEMVRRNEPRLWLAVRSPRRGGPAGQAHRGPGGRRPRHRPRAVAVPAAAPFQVARGGRAPGPRPGGPQPAVADRPRLALPGVLPERRPPEEPGHPASPGPREPGPVHEPGDRPAVARGPGLLPLLQRGTRAARDRQRLPAAAGPPDRGPVEPARPAGGLLPGAPGRGCGGRRTGGAALPTASPRRRPHPPRGPGRPRPPGPPAAAPGPARAVRVGPGRGPADRKGRGKAGRAAAVVRGPLRLGAARGRGGGHTPRAPGRRAAPRVDRGPELRPCRGHRALLAGRRSSPGDLARRTPGSSGRGTS